MLDALSLTQSMSPQNLPFQLSSQAIDEFQTLWQKHYGTSLNREQATARAHQLLALLQLLAGAEQASSVSSIATLEQEVAENHS